MVIGITGGVGSGKSTVIDYISKITNADVILTDNLAKKLMEPENASYIEVVKNFGDEILNPDKTINRKKLGKIVFNDNEKLELLNKCTHPYVCNYLIDYIAKNSDKLIVIESALLFDCEIAEMCDETWYIYASKENRRERLKTSRNYSDEKIDQMMASQKSDEFFKEKATIVIENNDIKQMQHDVYLVLKLHAHYVNGFIISNQ